MGKKKNKTAVTVIPVGKQKRRDIMFNESPLCRSCGCTMTICFNMPNSYTLQHNSPRGWEDYGKNITLWCNECNSNDARWKQEHKIFSIKECLQWVSGNEWKKDGIWVVDWNVYIILENKLVATHSLIDWKFIKLKEWLSCRINGKITSSFDDWFNRRITGWVSLRHYYMGNGWYSLYSNPKLKEHWRYKTKEELEEEEEELFHFNLIINSIC